MNKNTIRIIILLVLLVSMGCAFDIGNPDKRVKSAIGLITAKNFLNTTATFAKRLCEQGVLSDDDCETAEIAYMEGKDALISAKEIWDIMVVRDSFDGNEEYADLIKSVVKFTTIIETIVRKAD